MKTKQELMAEIKEINQAINESSSDIEIERLYVVLDQLKKELRKVAGW